MMVVHEGLRVSVNIIDLMMDEKAIHTVTYVVVVVDIGR